jgi:hypothetical protein
MDYGLWARRLSPGQGSCGGSDVVQSPLLGGLLKKPRGTVSCRLGFGKVGREDIHGTASEAGLDV